MKILMLTPYMPFPPSSGGQVRSYNLIKHLSKNHEIYLVALVKNDTEKDYQSELKPYCKEIYVCKRSESPWTVRNVTRSVFGKFPFVVVRNYSPKAKRTIARLLKQYTFDLIHAETFYIMPHIPKTSVPIFLVEQTIEYQVYQHFVNQIRFSFLRPLFLPDIIKLKYWEKSFWRHADLVGAVSETDEDHMHRLIPDLPTTVIPNAAGEDLLSIYKPRKKAEPIFLYIGNYSWLQNVEGAQILIHKIFPQMRKKIPNARCIIAGQRAYEKLGDKSYDGIEIIDIASSDTKKVVEVFSKASIFLAPLEGPGGTRLKILGAMAAGMPVIASKTGFSGLDITHRKDVFIAKRAQDYVDYSLELLNNQELYDSIRVQAKKLIDDVYSWSSVARKLEDIYLALTHK